MPILRLLTSLVDFGFRSVPAADIDGETDRRAQDDAHPTEDREDVIAQRVDIPVNETCQEDDA